MAEYDTLNQRFATLPQTLQAAVSAIPLSKTIFEIGQRWALGIDKIGDLADLVTEVISGQTRAAEFVRELKDRIGVSSEQAGLVARDVNAKVFRPIREKLEQATRALLSPQPPAITGPAAESGSRDQETLSRPRIPDAPKPKIPPPPAIPTSRPSISAKRPEPLVIRPLAPQQSLGRVSVPPLGAGEAAKPPAPLSVARPAETRSPKPAGIEPVAPIISPLGITAETKPEPAPPPGATVRRAVPEPVPKPLAPSELSRGMSAGQAAPAVETVRPLAAPAAKLPVPPPSPRAGYERAREAVRKELESFRAPPVAPATPPADAPSPYVITKEELREEIERHRASASPTPSGGTPPTKVLEPAPLPAAKPPAPAPAPITPPPTKFPKPPAPERYTVDPYKEAVE